MARDKIPQHLEILRQQVTELRRIARQYLSASHIYQSDETDYLVFDVSAEGHANLELEVRVSTELFKVSGEFFAAVHDGHTRGSTHSFGPSYAVEFLWADPNCFDAFDEWMAARRVDHDAITKGLSNLHHDIGGVIVSVVGD